jgi:glycosyltransferase involved in cell wall biosynthesis
MRLLFLNHNVAWRAGFFRAYHWARYLARKGHHLTLLTISESNVWGFESQHAEGVHLVKTPDLLTGRLRSGWDPWDTVNRILYLASDRFDLVHAVDSRPVCILPALVLQKLRGATLVLDWLDWWGRGGTIAERSQCLAERGFAPIETFFEEGFRRWADGAVVITSALKERALSLGVRPERLVHLPFGADVEGIHPRRKTAARARLGLSGRGPLLGYVGNILPKDGELLLESFRLINREEKGAKLLMIGRGRLNASHVGPDLNGKVMFTGAVSYDQLQDYMAACDLMVLPLKDTIANRGRWPSKVCDYLAAGRPVAATAVGDLKNLFSGKPIGGLSQDTPESFAANTLELLRHPRLTEMGRNARLVAEQELSWGLLTDRLESFYIRVTNMTH